MFLPIFGMYAIWRNLNFLLCSADQLIHTYDNINAYDYGGGISIAKGIKMKTSQNTYMYVCLQDIFFEKDGSISNSI